MRNNFIYLTALVLLASSCSRENPVTVTINPLQFNFNADIAELQELQKKRNSSLTYENSYEGENVGLKYFYFDDENDSLHYHFDVYTIGDKIEGINGAVSSDILSADRMYVKVETEILPEFRKSTVALANAKVIGERKITEDIRGKNYYYHFEVTTQELEKKFNKLNNR